MALAAVTATLQFWLSNVLNDPSSPLGSVTVTAKAPDLAEASQGKGDNSDLIVNLFLHQVTPNASWRNIDLPTLSKDGRTRLTNQALALDLHYLLTAYGTRDTEAEALLGFSVLMLHETPILPRSQIRTALAGLPNTNPYVAVLKNAGLADQFEMIKITPATLGREEMAWLWTALKADYRPTFPFQVSVVLIQPETPVSFPLPVLSRNLTIEPGLGPSLLQIDTTGNPAIPAPSATVTVDGAGLSAVNRISLVNAHLGVQYPPFAPASTTVSSVSFVVPNDPPNLPAGIYQMTVQIVDAGGVVQASSNSLLLPIAPTILPAPPPVAANNPQGTLITLHCAPEVLTNQKVALIMNGIAVAARTITAKTNTVSFQFPLLAPGPYLARLSVDGIASPVQVNWGATPPVFQGPMVTV
jgi:Pvc16 N-terminal domain